VVAAFLISLREGLEAALIVGIIAAYLVKIGRRDALRNVWLGVGAALGLSVALGVVVVLTVGRLPVSIQESLEAVAGLFAVAVLTWMLFWMRRAGRAIKGDLEHGIDLVLSNKGATALAGLAFVAVSRESLETMLLFLAVLSSAGADLSTALGIGSGLAVAVAIGGAIFLAGVRVNLRRFFTATGVVLIFVAAGLIAFSVHAFGEAGVIANDGAIFSVSGLLPESSPLGTLLSGLFGYRSSPSLLEAIGYLVYLVPTLAFFVFGNRISLRARTVPA
jgi:high-affinity iron transporter